LHSWHPLAKLTAQQIAVVRLSWRKEQLKVLWQSISKAAVVFSLLATFSSVVASVLHSNRRRHPFRAWL
jgi:hypothetical protein